MIPPLEKLKKESIGATYEHINRLLQNKDFDGEEFIKYNENLNAFEKKIQAIYINTFKIKEGVINCLLSNDPHLVRRILKCDWFFEDALSPECYEKDIFPNVSFSTRCKIINKLARNIKSEQHAEELFKFTNLNYGRKYAEMFVAKCSFQFISDYITTCKPLFIHHDSEKNLINICKRFPDIVITFIQNEMKGTDFRRPLRFYSKVIKYLAKNHPLAFMPIFEKHYLNLFHFHFGKKSSKVLCSELLKLAEKNPEIMLSEKVNVSVIFKCLSFEEQTNFLKLIIQARSGCPRVQELKSWSLALNDLKDLLKLKQPNERVRLVEAAFLQLFNKKYSDHPEVWSLKFLELFPTEYRVRLVEVLQKSNEDQTIKCMLQSQCRDLERDAKDIFIYLLSCKNAFPLLTQLMTQMTSVVKREILLKEMIVNSIINRDPEGLESVVRYISVRHKNEDPVIMNSLIKNYLLTSPDIINLTVWDLLEKLATLRLVSLKDNSLYEEILESYIAFKLKNNLDPLCQIKNIIKLSFVNSKTSFVLVQRMEKSYSRSLLMLYYNEIFSVDSDYGDEEVKEKLALSLLLSFNVYNRGVRRTRIKIEDLPLLVEAIDKMIKDVDKRRNDYVFISAITSSTFLKSRYSGVLLDLSLEPNILNYLLKSHPDYIFNSLDKIINHILKYNEKFENIFTSRCQIDFLDWMPQLEALICEKFKTSDSSSVKVNALKVYSLIADLENFKEIIKEYLPNGERFQTGKAEFHEVQINVPGLIKNVKPVSKNLNLVVKYLSKDFLRWVIPSFFSVCHNSSVSVMIPFLKSIFHERDVSVKKVILHSILDLSPKYEGLLYCKFLWDNERHPSVRETIFKAISRNFRKNPSNKVFEMVKKCIMESDEITIGGRLSLSLVPLQFLNEYSSVLWQFTDKYGKRRFAANYRQEIINNFNSKNISVLPDEFCVKVLRLYLFRPYGEVKVEDFFCHYMVHHSQSIDRKISLMFDLLKEKRPRYDSVVNIINCMKNMAKNNPRAVFAIFEELLKEWPNMYGSCKMFKEYLLLNYMKGYSTAFKVSDSVNELFGAALGKELRKVVNAVPMYSCYIEIFNSTLTDFLSYFKFQAILEVVINNFLGNSFGHVEGIIAINLLPWEVFSSFKIKPDNPEYNNPYKVKTRERYREIFSKLMDKNFDCFKIYCNLHMDDVLD